MKKMPIIAIMVLLALTSITPAQQGVRIKDVAHIGGMEDIQLFGYGLAVGLDGTGDRSQTVFTQQTVINMLKNIGITVPSQSLWLRNVAAVMVMATMTPYKSKGTKFDVIVSSMGDATSLAGGTLILTALQGPDGTVYASAQGPVALEGYDPRQNMVWQSRRSHILTGRIPDGAIVQREYAYNLLNGKSLSLSLNYPDFTSAVSLARSVNAAFVKKGGAEIAKPLDAGTISLDYGLLARDPDYGSLGMVDFISRIENLTFDVSTQARVVVNERTGTIVAGGQVRISQIAVSHGGIKVEITAQPEAVQPKPFNMSSTEEAPVNGQTTGEKPPDMVVLGATTTVSDLAQALNSLGVTPRDIIAILQAIKEAGALQAQLVIL